MPREIGSNVCNIKHYLFNLYIYALNVNVHTCVFKGTVQREITGFKSGIDLFVI